MSEKPIWIGELKPGEKLENVEMITIFRLANLRNIGFTKVYFQQGGLTAKVALGVQRVRIFTPHTTLIYDLKSSPELSIVAQPKAIIEMTYPTTFYFTADDYTVTDQPRLL